MDVFEQAQKAIREIKESINPGIRFTVEVNKELLLNQQTNEQLRKGLDSIRKTIRPKYANSTISIKKRKKQPFDIVTLRDTGDFYDSIQIEVLNDKFVISSSNQERGDGLAEKYGENIFGLDQEFLKEFTLEIIVPNIKQVANDKLTRS